MKVEDTIIAALRRAAPEVHEGLRLSEQLATLVDRDIILTTAWEDIASALQQAEARTGSPCLTWHPEVSTERCPGILW
ncbi:MAG: hypothetical protein V3R80_12790 [Candidatus Tectomicrobia bacterium]